MNATTWAANTNANAKPWYRHRWPWLLMLGPAVVIVVGAYTSWLALSGQDALVTDDYYRQGKAINQDLRRDRAAASLGLTAAMRYDAFEGRLIGRLFAHELAYAATVLIRLVHPTRPERDLTFTTQTDAAGMFVLPLAELDRACWLVQIEDTQGNWRLRSDWAWPERQSIEIGGEQRR